MRLRLYHHRDGARVAYREAGTGPGLVLLHSAMLNHREFEPSVDGSASRRLTSAWPFLGLRCRAPAKPVPAGGL